MIKRRVDREDKLDIPMFFGKPERNAFEAQSLLRGGQRRNENVLPLAASTLMMAGLFVCFVRNHSKLHQNCRGEYTSVFIPKNEAQKKTRVFPCSRP